MADQTPSDQRRRIFHGLAWTTLYRVFETAAAFAAMLVLVRLISPADYGRAAAVVGLLTILNAVGFGLFVSQALQLEDGAEPDWSLHWSVGLYIQGGLSLLCHAIAGLCWFSATYRPIAPLIHVAALGLLLDWPNWLGGVMLRRRMDFRRLQTLNGVATLGSLLVTVVVALIGDGALAIVLGSNVARALPFGVDLLLVRGWRPTRGWWRWPRWAAYRPALHFGLQQSGSALLHGVRGALEAAVLPLALGYAAIGLLGRAQALFAMSVGRLADIVTETVYPLLPRYAANPQTYPRQASAFAQAVCLLVLPGAVYIGLEGPTLSRLLYGERWIAADPLFLPAAVFGTGLALFHVSSSVLLAANRLRTCLSLDVAAAVLTVPMVAVAWAGGGLTAYAWAVAATQLLAAALALRTASRCLVAGWVGTVLTPPLVSGALGGGAVVVLRGLWAGDAPALHLALSAGIFLLVSGLALRGLFPRALALALTRFPWGDRLRGLLRLSGVSPIAASP